MKRLILTIAGCLSMALALSQECIIGKSAFAGCSSLKTIDIPMSISVEDGAFSGCTELFSFQSKNIIEWGDSVFLNCRSLEKIG